MLVSQSIFANLLMLSTIEKLEGISNEQSDFLSRQITKKEDIASTGALRIFYY